MVMEEERTSLYRLRVFENRVLSRIFVAKRRKWWDIGEDINEGFITCTLHILLG
jgi:hypothetical protein